MLSLSLVVPVYNENPKWFREALDSWVRNRPDEIIAVIDETDRACRKVFDEFSQTAPCSTRLLITPEPGKRSALARGIRAAQGEIVALVDSDTAWERDVKSWLLAPFADVSVGGVGSRQAVLRPQTLAQRLFSIRLDMRYFHEMAALAASGDAVTCLSGRTVFYRRSALIGLIDDLVNERFLGKLCISGDDKRLTQLLQQNGWKMRYQQTACVWTHGARRLSAFLRQHVRWARNSWRTDMRMLFSRWVWKREKWLAYHLLDRFAQPFALMLGPIALGVSLLAGQWAVAGLLVGWWLVSRTIKLWPHLKRHSADMILMPLYAFLLIYVLGVLKIYALVTVDHQDWITRWDRQRRTTLSLGRRLVAYGTTLSLLLVLGIAVTGSGRAVMGLKESEDLSEIPFAHNPDTLDLQSYRSEIVRHTRTEPVGRYVIREEDTLEKIAKRFRVAPAALIGEYTPRVNTNAMIPSGQPLDVSVADLRAPLPVEVTSFSRLDHPVAMFDPLSHTIRVRGAGNVVTLSSVAEALQNPNLLERQGGGEWILRANLYVSDGVTLVIDGREVSWLKLSSAPQGFVTLQSYNGNLFIQGTKITSWDETRNAPDTVYADGRSFILARANGRMDIVRSELAYLGHPLSLQDPSLESRGGVYGVSWKIPNGTFGQTLLTGTVVGNRIHDNYFGLYMFGATGMVVRDNEVFANIQYGIDPHDDSNLFLIERNHVHHNGNHGIIVSKRVIKSMIRYNLSEYNRLHGIMLDKQSNYNIVEENTVVGNVDGLAIYDSHSNLIRRNHFERNRHGIRANMNASYNYFENNVISGSDSGIYLYRGARMNFLVDTVVKESLLGIYVKEARDNFIVGKTEMTDNHRNIKLDREAYYATFIQRF
jgi:hyaluronan synthase